MTEDRVSELRMVSVCRNKINSDLPLYVEDFINKFARFLENAAINLIVFETLGHLLSFRHFIRLCICIFAGLCIFSWNDKSCTFPTNDQT